MNKLIIFTAPSGAGKTTIVRHLLSRYEELAFSVSATTRERRHYEIEGRDYYFLSEEQFREKIAAGEFAEWEEVYDNQLYGTLKSEITRLWSMNKSIIFDVDVRGATSLKNHYKDQALAVFVKPPSFQTLVERLRQRKTESSRSLRKRLNRVKTELKYENKFDVILLNDVLEVTLKEAELIVEDFLGIVKD